MTEQTEAAEVVLSEQEREALEVGTSLFGWSDAATAMRHLEPIVAHLIAAAEARGAERALLPIRRFAEAGAISAKALGRNDRDFLDLIILCDEQVAAAVRGVEGGAS